LSGPATAGAEGEDARFQKLEEEDASLRDDVTSLGERLDQLLPLRSRLTGYVDFGFFATGGDGAGTRVDLGNRVFPEYAGVVSGSWVFMGDPLSTAINSRGEPADTGDSRAVTFDPVDSQGHPSFIANAVNLTLFVPLSERLLLNASLDMVPRSRDVSDPTGLFVGDFVDVKLAYAEYRAPLEFVKLSLYAGKMESVLGFEYRTQDAPFRLGVTPSLICRYTCGRPLGVKARTQFLDETLVLNVSVTNGSTFSEGFPLSDEIDSNAMKTVSGRLSYRLPLGTGFELGASGAYGAQDLQENNGIRQWHVGADAHFGSRDFDVTAEVVHGRANGRTEPGQAPCGIAPCLDYKGAYLLAGYRLTNTLMPYVRADWRDALHESGDSFVYVSKLARATGGLRYEPAPYVLFKAEYILNRELGRIPQFSNDVFTTSVIFKY
jgi:hypothetical protein